MGYQYWPSGLPPYTPYTYVKDGSTILNHLSIESGLARDVAVLQHHINTTHLFASGWLNPITSGYFQNIDVNNLYADNINTRIFSMYNINIPHINTLVISGTVFNASNSAFLSNNISVGGSFTGPLFSLSVNGLVYSPKMISGSLWNYILVSGVQNQLLNGDLNTLTVMSGNIIVDPTHNILIESFNGFNPQNSISESGLYWNAFGGHDHLGNKILARNILDDLVNYNGDLTIHSGGDGMICVQSGNINAADYKVTNNYTANDFYLLDHSSIGIYSGFATDLIVNSKRNPLSGSNPVVGNLSDLDIGLYKMVSYNGSIWAISKTLPTGCLDNRKTFIYNSNDLCTWQAVLISGFFSIDGTYILASGNASIDDIMVYQNNLYLLWNLPVTSGNYCTVFSYNNYLKTAEHTTGITYGLGSGGFGSSKYGLGISYVDEFITVYGYEYPHVWVSGLYKWDRDCIYNNAGTMTSLSTSADVMSVNISGATYCYEYPFMNIYVPAAIPTDGSANSVVWLDGSIGGDNPCLTTVRNNGVYQLLPKDSAYFSGYYAGFFGNGFSEITSILPLTNLYHSGKKGYFTYLNYTDNSYAYGADLIDNYTQNPILVFGSFLVQGSGVSSYSTSNIFGGCVPIVMDLDRRLFTYNATYSNVLITSGNALFAPNVLHGSRSLMDSNYLFRLPSKLYCYGNNASGLAVSNLWYNNPNNNGRLWTDLSSPAFNNTRDALINICPWQPGYGVFPFGGASNIYYQHDGESSPTKLIYKSGNTWNSGLMIDAGTYTNKNMPTYYDRPTKDGFWSSKSFDWYYMPASGYCPEPPSGSYPKTYYYMKPTHPLQYNGVVYCILENNTGFMYIGPDGPVYIDDNIMYSDLIQFGNTIYGVGSKVTFKAGVYNYRIALTKILKAESTEITIPNSINNGKKTPHFVIHNNVLYVGLGGGIFLVKIPSQLDLCITTI